MHTSRWCSTFSYLYMCTFMNARHARNVYNVEIYSFSLRLWALTVLYTNILLVHDKLFPFSSAASSLCEMECIRHAQIHKITNTPAQANTRSYSFRDHTYIYYTNTYTYNGVKNLISHHNIFNLMLAILYVSCYIMTLWYFARIQINVWNTASSLQRDDMCVVLHFGTVALHHRKKKQKKNEEKHNIQSYNMLFA